MNGWYVGRWWEGSKEEQAKLLKKYNCTAAQRESLLPSTLAPATSGITSGRIDDIFAVSDSGHVREKSALHSIVNSLGLAL